MYFLPLSTLIHDPRGKSVELDLIHDLRSKSVGLDLTAVLQNSPLPARYLSQRQRNELVQAALNSRRISSAFELLVCSFSNSYL